MDRRKNIAAFAAALGMLLLIMDNRCANSSSQQAIELCIRTVIPSLFPFLFLASLLTDSLQGVNGCVFRYLAGLLGIPFGAESVLLSGFLGGYPAGAIVIGDSFHKGNIDRNTAQKLLSYCSNAGPAFLFGMIAPQFPEKWMPWSLWGIHILSAVMVGTLYFLPNNTKIVQKNERSPHSNNLLHAVKSMGMICGWIILFRIIIGFLDRWILWMLPIELRILLWGVLELSNGCCSLSEISTIPTRFIIASAMLSFGGLCVTMQTASVISGLSIKGYLRGKITQTFLSILMAFSIWYGQGILICILCATFIIIKVSKKRSSILSQSGV